MQEFQLEFFNALGRVRMGPGKSGKSWNFIVAFSRTGKSWTTTTTIYLYSQFIKREPLRGTYRGPVGHRIA